mmetsp:Transcript_23261/g.68668  ORF Transcript_23261/g.68668 Transcript_23261/m.68668 type:complete len:307 (+) Transcript_23261:379-1299(+)
MVQQRLARVDELVRDLRLCVALGARRRRPPLLRRERRKGRDEKVPLQPPHLLVHLAHQVLGRCAGGELVEREAAQPLRPPVRTRRRRGGGGSLASACSRRAAAAGALARPAPRGAEQLWPAESVVFVVLCRRRRGLIALEDLRQSELPLVTFEERNLPRRLDVPKLLDHRPEPRDDPLLLGRLEHLDVPRAQLLALHRPPLLGRPRVENVLVARARRLHPHVHVLESAPAAGRKVRREQRAVGCRAVAVRRGAEIADRIDVGDVDAARVGLRAVGAVLLRVHHEDHHVVPFDALQRDDAAGGVREL